MDFQLIDGIRCYAPQLAYRNRNFPPEKFHRLLQAEKRNFWYRSRSRILQHLVERFIGGRPADFLEIGCGTGSILEGLSRLGSMKLHGAEIYLSGLHLAKARLPEIDFMQLDASEMPFDREFDAVGLFDVLEHLDNDDLVLRNVFKALMPGGHVFVTAPQHPFLWSSNDAAACHRRRYARGELADKLRRAGFRIEAETSFMTALFPVMAAARLLKRRLPQGDPYEAVLRELEIPDSLNALLEIIMRVDEALISRGFSLPFGGSIAIVGLRPGGR